MTRVMGIDLGTHKATYAIIGPMDTGDLTLMAGATHDALTEIRDMALADVGRLIHDVALFYSVDYVWIEEAILGNNRKYSIQLAQMQGAVLAYLNRLRPELDIRCVDNKVWKRDVVGNGNASKEQIRNYVVVTHPGYAPLCEDEQDRYDAVCIALYGITVLERAKELAQPGGLAGSD